MELTYFEKREFYEQGYLLVPGVVPKARVDAALRVINHSLGQGMKEEDMTKFRAQSYCPELTRTDEIVGLVTKTPAWDFAESLIGVGEIDMPTSAQIALRFPGLHNPPSAPKPHLDGIHTPTNGVPKGVIMNFTMLVGVFLSDVPHDFAGNFTVWSGTHHQYEQYFQEHGAETILDGMPSIDLPPPTQLRVQAGDVAFVHYETAHAASLNISPNVRYALFFRLHRHGHNDRKVAVMTDIWQEWDGMREIVAEQTGLQK